MARGCGQDRPGSGSPCQITLLDRDSLPPAVWKVEALLLAFKGGLPGLWVDPQSSAPRARLHGQSRDLLIPELACFMSLDPTSRIPREKSC